MLINGLIVIAIFAYLIWSRWLSHLERKTAQAQQAQMIEVLTRLANRS